jgi:K+-transporting ATPase ATPase C chain
VPRIARARQISPDRVQSVLERAIQSRDLGLFGEPRVNVLAANLALDQQFGKPASPMAPAASNK